jgi:hypothetical protein
LKETRNMSKGVKTLGLGVALVAGSLLAGSLLVGAPAQAAEVSVGVALPGVAFGYTDGYWDRDRQWHAWRNHEEMERWRAENREHFHEWHHERDHDHGWHEGNRYWDRH